MALWRQLTARGRAFLIGGMLSSGALIYLNQRQALWIMVTVALLPIVAIVMTNLPKAKIVCHHAAAPQRTEIGNPTMAQLSLEVTPAFIPTLMQFHEEVDSELGVQPYFDPPRLFSRWRRQITYPLSAHTRGIWRIGPLHVRNSDPFDLVRTNRVIPGYAEVIVTPKIWDLSASGLRPSGGITGDNTPHRIGSSVYDDALVREHREGDDLRRVHWKSTARHGELMVRREEQVLDPAVTIFLDSRESAFPAAMGNEAFEWAVSATASIAQHLLNQRYRLTVLDADGPRLLPRHDDPLSSREDLLMAMTTQQTTKRSTLGHTFNHESARSRGRTLIAILGKITKHETTQMTRLLPKSRGWVIILDPDPDHEVLQLFASQQWRVVTVNQGQTVQQAWLAMELPR